jgi:hypothetical protein
MMRQIIIGTIHPYHANIENFLQKDCCSLEKNEKRKFIHRKIHIEMILFHEK